MCRLIPCLFLFLFIFAGMSAAVAQDDPTPTPRPPDDPVEKDKPGKKPKKPKKPAKPTPDQILMKEIRKVLASKEPGRMGRSLEMMNRLLFAYPKSRHTAEALYISGELHYAAGRFYEAHLKFRRILEKHQGIKRLGEVIGREFEIGMAYIQGKKTTTWLGFEVKAESLGEEILSNLVRHYEQDGFDDARYQIGEYWFRKRSWERAIDAYERLIDEYPESDWVPAARYKVALTHLSQSEGFNHDLRPVYTAEKLLEEYIQDYPAGGIVAEAEKTLIRIKEALARRDTEVAQFYLDRDRPLSAAIYYQAVLREQPQAKAVKVALRKLSHIADKKLNKKASRFARRILREWYRNQGKSESDE